MKWLRQVHSIQSRYSNSSYVGTWPTQSPWVYDVCGRSSCFNSPLWVCLWVVTLCFLKSPWAYGMCMCVDTPLSQKSMRVQVYVYMLTLCFLKSPWECVCMCIRQSIKCLWLPVQGHRLVCGVLDRICPHGPWLMDSVVLHRVKPIHGSGQRSHTVAN